MNRDLKDYRKSYEKGMLLEKDIPNDPFILFRSWFETADASPEVDEANAMSISTVGKDMMPKTRIVLLKGYDLQGFYFYTNYSSEKGRALEENPQCCISFFWPALEKQIIIQGMAEKISKEASEAYFHSRPRGSQLGALASDQSSQIESRTVLEEKLNKLEQDLEGKEIPLPQSWGGYIVKPRSFEFWQGRRSRLHDRIRFSLNAGNWNIERLAP
ncbi:pyridoxamine 5'-phosphate oxidase [Christiangramia aquimixticola]|uniref:pyridoxamine 5'-phosphate oxidase n=1 Tax=Christiangramia aquimixticola TaxID=1697558 RepID=UPI003AA87D94